MFMVYYISLLFLLLIFTIKINGTIRNILVRVTVPFVIKHIVLH